MAAKSEQLGEPREAKKPRQAKQNISKIDASGRVAIPPESRKLLPEQDLRLVFSDVVHPGQTIPYYAIFTESYFETWIDKAFDQKGGFKNDDLDDFKRKLEFKAKYTPVRLDQKTNRIGLDETVLGKAQLEPNSDAMIIPFEEGMVVLGNPDILGEWLG